MPTFVKIARNAIIYQLDHSDVIHTKVMGDANVTREGFDNARGTCSLLADLLKPITDVRDMHMIIGTMRKIGTGYMVACLNAAITRACEPENWESLEDVPISTAANAQTLLISLADMAEV